MILLARILLTLTVIALIAMAWLPAYVWPLGWTAVVLFVAGGCILGTRPSKGDE